MITKPGYSKKYGFHFTDKDDYMQKYHIVAVRDKKLERYSSDPKYRRTIASTKLKNKYGITLEEKERMIQDQDNKCLRCGLPFEGTSQDALAPAVDHDHSLGNGNPKAIKGILHTKCNTKLGIHNDSIEELQISIDYLKKYGVKK
tara:strand:- start:19 stop:453 length:435 start_codon:yes stop_codon:yes gene_type:complete